MIINVFRIKKDVGATTPFNFSGPTISTGAATYADLEISGEVLNNGAVLKVTGQIHGEARFVCGRCLEPYLAKVEVPFQEDFKEGLPEDQDADLSWYQGDSIDIAETVRERLILAEPFKQVCCEQCKGLCPACGKNLNMESCTCTTEVVNPKFAVLQKLLENNPTER